MQVNTVGGTAAHLTL